MRRIPAGKLLEAAKRKQALDFIWIGSDAWVSRESVVYGREEVMIVIINIIVSIIIIIFRSYTEPSLCSL